MNTFFKKAGITLGLLVWVFAVFMLVQLLFGQILVAVQALGVSFQGMNTVVFSAAVGIVIYSATLLLVIGVPWWVLEKKTTLKQLGVQRPPRLTDILWLGGGIVGYLIFTLVATSLAMAFLPFIDFAEKQETGYEAVSQYYEYVLAFIGLVIVAPIAEELLFRGYLFGKLKQYNIKTWVIVLVTSALFGIAHMQLNVMVDTFALGVALALLRVFSGSIWPSILLHMAKNGLAYYLLFINTSFLSTLGG